MIRQAATLACIALLSGAAIADGPSNTVTNGSFETPDTLFPFVPLGWTDIPLDNGIWADGIARTGTRSIGLGLPGAGTFIGWTTNIADNDTGELFDPPYEYGGGDLHVTGYYMTPVGEGLGPVGQPPLDIVGIKLEFRRVPPNFSIYQAFEFHIPLGNTGGEWLPFEITITPDMISPDFPPFPGSVSILPFRFILPNVVAQGTIYWDDFCVWQDSTACPPDLNGDGIVDNGDIGAFVAAFLGGNLAADFNGDGILDNGDIGAFVAAFLAGC